MKEVMEMKLQNFSRVFQQLVQLQKRLRRYWTVMLVKAKGTKPTISGKVDPLKIHHG